MMFIQSNPMRKASSMPFADKETEKSYSGLVTFPRNRRSGKGEDIEGKWGRSKGVT